MVGSVKVENVFGQVLICLRMSNLDFVIKETPYSAYITIRKKFVKAIKEDMHEENSVVDKGTHDELKIVKDELKNVLRDNQFLKSRINDLEKDCATLRVDNEELEIRVDISEKDKLALEDDIEVAFSESRELRKKVSAIVNEKSLLQRQLDNVLKDKEETVSILESTIESRIEEIKILKAESNFKDDDSGSESDSQKPSISSKSSKDCDSCNSGFLTSQRVEEHVENVQMFSCKTCGCQAVKAEILSKHMHEKHRFDCDHCDFISQSEETFNLHMEEYHEYKCENCNLAHGDKWKHTIHICREEIHNPTYNSFYTKSWLNRNGCNGLYCSERNEDVVWLHDQKCWSGELCCCWTPHVYFGKPAEPGEVKHLEYSRFVKDKKLVGLMSGT